MTREESNRKIAEWLTPLKEMHEYNTAGWGFVEHLGWQPLDFYTSEEASALVLEKLPRAGVEHLVKDWSTKPMTYEWRVQALLSEDPDEWTEVYNADRKTAIAEAALKRIEVESR